MNTCVCMFWLRRHRSRAAIALSVLPPLLSSVPCRFSEMTETKNEKVQCFGWALVAPPWALMGRALMGWAPMGLRYTKVTLVG